jgi:glucokinase
MQQLEKHGSPVLAVDIGGTKILVAIFSPDLQILTSNIVPTQAQQGINSIIERLYSAIDDILQQSDMKPTQLGGISIACAGGIDTARGVVVTPSPNLPDWVNVPLRNMIEERYHVPTAVLNDASAAALAEHRFGSGRDVNNLVLFTLGTGIGGGIITDGTLYLGACGAAAELGHMTIADNGPECSCGNTGCLEMLASGRAVERDAVNLLSRGEESSLHDMVKGEIETVTAEQVGDAAQDGDALALDIISRAAYYLGIGMINMVNIFNPEMIVLGGGMAELDELFIEPGRRMVNERAFPISAQSVRIVTAELGNDAGVYGAATFIHEQILRRDG